MHIAPASTLHSEEHPSPSSLFPSSHASSAARRESPQMGTQWSSANEPSFAVLSPVGHDLHSVAAASGW